MVKGKKRIVAIIQARMGSSRLPGKVLKDIVGRPMLWHIFDRLNHAKLVDQIVIATSDNEKDKPIVAFAKDNKIDYYAGSELDLLDRWYQTVKKFKADAMVRITADCPLVDPIIVDEVVKYYLEKDPFDYVSNARPKATYPHGLDVEIYSLKALRKAWHEITDAFIRKEWPSGIFFEHPEKYRIANIKYKEDLSYMRWTVDYEDDLKFVTEIYKKLYQEEQVFLMEDILSLIKKYPELMAINAGHIRDEAYFEALKTTVRRVRLMQHPLIVGKKVDLYGVEEGDFTERLLRWRNDPEVTYHLFQGVIPSSRELLKDEYEHLIRSNTDVVLAIVDKKTGTRVGITGYHEIDWIARHGEHRMIIGEKEFWGKGYGNEVVEVMTAFGFSRLNLNKVRSGANIENIVSIKCYERLNFVREGIFRKHQYRHGKYYDAVMFSIFRDEFIAAMKTIYGDDWTLEKALSGK